MMLDIVIDLINRKTGGGTKYINQRDKDFLFASIQEENYRKSFTRVLKEYVIDNRIKYAHFTDMIYISIFREKAREYKKILDLKANENFNSLQAELSETEDEISSARQFYSDTVLLYNNKIQMFPSSIVAGLFGFKEEKFFEATATERENVKVSFDK